MVSHKISSLAAFASALLSLSMPCSAITAGITAAAEDFKFVVSVQTPGSGGLRQLCTGSIVGPKTVLTAASCCDGRDTSTLSIRYGTHNRTIGGSSIAITNATIYPDWSYASNFCILYLEKLDPSAYDITPVNLATQPSSGYIGTEAQIAGFGNTAYGSSAALQLQSGKQTIISSEECAAGWDDAGVSVDSALCGKPLEGSDTSACAFDNGGPVYDGENGVLVGVVSYFDIYCKSVPQNNIYADVSVGRDWITSHIL